MSNFDDLRNEALKKAELAHAFSGKPTTFFLFPIDFVLARFPSRPDREHVDTTKKFGKAAIAGRIILRRDAGKKLMFLTIKDRTGQIQVAINASMIAPEQMELLRSTISVWDVMSFEGELSFSNSGEPTLWVSAAEFMAKSLRSAPDKIVGVTDKEIRYRQRYLDLICDDAVMARFIARSRIITKIRETLRKENYLEVDTPILETVSNGAAARPFETHLNALDLNMRLRIATEIALKKLIVGGMERVFEIGRIFRNEGIDKSHNPEFTSIEMYQAYGSLNDMRLLALNILQPLIGADEWRCENFMDLIREHTGQDPWDEAAMREAFISVSLDTENGRTNLAQEMSGKAQSLRGAALLDEVFSAFVEPKLLGPTFVCHQPLEQSPLCRAWAEDPRLADRFEIYVNGMEVANAYQELNDPIEQRKRLEAQGVVDEDFIEALEHGMPACAGMGIGIDRLCMIALGAESIRDVILFPLMRPEHG